MADLEAHLDGLVGIRRSAPAEAELASRLEALEAELDAALQSQGEVDGLAEFVVDEDPQQELLTTFHGLSKDEPADEGLAWLRRRAPSSSAFDQAVSLLASSSSDDAIPDGLLDAFGLDNVELIGEALKQRRAVRAELDAQNASLLAAASDMQRVASDPSRPSKQPDRIPRHPYVPSAQISVETASSKKAQKQSLKDQRRLHRHHQRTPDDGEGAIPLEEWDRIRAAQLASAADGPLFSAEGRADEEDQNPHIFTSKQGGNTLSWFGSRYTLPAGTSRREAENYEEITIPAAGKLPPRAGEAPIRIADLDELARPCFPGYKTLNRLQSVVFPVAYKTNENMLICAPTGAGKTDVAMLAILRAIAQHGTPPSSADATGGARPGRWVSPPARSFKIVYVAPMKALAAEVVRKMSKRLAWLGFVVKELTGDMQLSRAEIAETHLIVTTPEKWDVVTRKATGADDDLATKVRLLIIDEVHLLHEDRGAVIESIVARTLRQVESSQSLIRIVGLSATLPNYVDVSDFLRVNRLQGLFFFDASFRPVPLEQHFLGVKGKAGSSQSKQNLDDATFEKVAEMVKQGHQVMVFVHARKETVKTAQTLREKAQADGILELFDPSEHPRVDLFKREVAGSKNRELKELFGFGFGIHHAGMLRSDRNLSERMFEAGVLKVLCCTATLAWGVNLPAYAVVIKGTQIYDASKGSFVDLGILDVLQIFGRAGRPQYEDQGVGYIVTSHDKLDHYVSAVTQQHPIESKFVEGIVDSLNAEVSLGTVSTVDEGVQWIGWTYLFVRMRKNPMVYGLTAEEVRLDPHLGSKRLLLIQTAARKLVSIGMITYDEDTGKLASTDLGRIASKYYIRHASVEIFNATFRPKMSEADVLAMLSSAVEYDQIKVRDSETVELVKLMEGAPCQVKGGSVTTAGKVNILLQAHISRTYIEDFALVSDSAYVAQNAGRIARALVEIGASRKWAQTAAVLIDMAKSIEKRLWPFAHPLAQSGLPPDVLFNVERWADELAVDELAKMPPSEAGKLIHLNERLGGMLVKAARQFPHLAITYTLQPLTSELLRLRLHLVRDFDWVAQVHGRGEPFWFWVQDTAGTQIYRLVHVMLRPDAKTVDHDLIIPVTTVPTSMTVRALSDRWVGCDFSVEIPLDGFRMPVEGPAHTAPQNLPMLDASDLGDEGLAALLGDGRRQLTPTETQCLHTVLHTPHNALICAAEPDSLTRLVRVALHRTLALDAKCLCLVVCSRRSQVPALVEAYRRVALYHGASVREALASSNHLANGHEAGTVLIGHPSALARSIGHPRTPALVVFGDLHVLDEVYESFVSRALKTWTGTRFIGHAYSLLDAADLASWLDVHAEHTHNFGPNVRSDPFSLSMRPFDAPLSHATSASMIKPAWATIRGSGGPAIVFASSPSHCRAAAREFLKLAASDVDAQALAASEDLLAPYAARFKDADLAEAVIHGVAVLHGSMQPRDQRLVLSLFASATVRTVITTRDVAWSTPLSAPTVVVLGTQFAATTAHGERIVGDYPLADLIQMQSCARPASDSPDGASFVVMCHQEHAEFYSKTLMNGLALESELTAASPRLLSHILSGVANGSIVDRQAVVDHLSWSFGARRFVANPFYYGIAPQENDSADDAVSRFADHVVAELFSAGTVRTSVDSIRPTAVGRLAVESDVGASRLQALRTKPFTAVAPLLPSDAVVPTTAQDPLKAYHKSLPRYVRDAVGDVDFATGAALTRTLVAGWIQRRVPSDEWLEGEQARLVVALARR